MTSQLFIKSIEIDQKNRIVVTVQDQIKAFLKEDQTKKMLLEASKKALGDDFIQLEISHSTFRVTVVEGKSHSAKERIESEIASQIEMAMQFMQQFDGQQD